MGCCGRLTSQGFKGGGAPYSRAGDIHRQRKEWDAREKEMVAYRLVDLVGRASAANILGNSVRELDKLVEIYELSARFTGLRDRGGAITWARELMGVSKKLLRPTVIDAVITKVNQKPCHEFQRFAQAAHNFTRPCGAQALRIKGRRYRLGHASCRASEKEGAGRPCRRSRCGHGIHEARAMDRTDRA